MRVQTCPESPRRIARSRRSISPNSKKRTATDPNGTQQTRREAERFRRFDINEIKEREYKLDITWLKDESLEDSDELPEPQDLASEAITELEAVVDDLREIVDLVEKVIDELPHGWVVTRLEDLTERIANVKPENWPEKEFRYLDISAIDNSRFIITDVKRFRGKDAPSRARRPIQPNDVLFSNVRTYLRNIALVPNCTAEICSTDFRS